MSDIQVVRRAEVGDWSVAEAVDAIVSDGSVAPLRYDTAPLEWQTAPRQRIRGLGYLAVCLPGTTAWHEGRIVVIDESWPHQLPSQQLASLAARDLIGLEPTARDGYSPQIEPLITERMCSSFQAPSCVVRVTDQATLYHPDTISPTAALLDIQTVVGGAGYAQPMTYPHDG